MDTLDKEILDDKLTQADLIKLMLHNAQHMATREEVKSDIGKVETTLKEDIQRVETTLKEDIHRVETTLTAKIEKVETTLTSKIDKVDAKLDRFQWLILATILTVLLKDYIFSFIK